MRAWRGRGLGPLRIAAGLAAVAMWAWPLGSALPSPSVLEAQAPPDFLDEFEGQFGASARKLVALAEAMPESTYDWSPMEGVASVARVYMHIARYNYMYPHENMGRETPVPPSDYRRWEDAADEMDKAEVIRILSESMDYVRSVADDMGSEALDEPTTLYGRQVGEYAVLFQLIAHMNEHLGQSIAYARSNGVVPPWSR